MILNLTVRSPARRQQTALSADTESRKSLTDHRSGWNWYGYVIRTIRLKYWRAPRYTLRRLPQPITIKVYPGVDNTAAAVYLDRYRARCPLNKHNRNARNNTVFIIIKVKQIVTQRNRLRLTVRLRIGFVSNRTKERTSYHVTGAVTEKKRRVSTRWRPRCIQQFVRIAKIQLLRRDIVRLMKMPCPALLIHGLTRVRIKAVARKFH